jgi:hypothetical protein
MVSAGGEAVVKWPEQRTVIRSLGCAALLMLIPAVLLAWWVAFPLSRELRGLAFSISGYSPGHPPVVPTSFGVLAAIVLVLAAVACLPEKPSSYLCAAGGGLLLIAFWAFLKVALGDAGLLVALAREAESGQAAYLFSTQYTLPIFANEPTVWTQISFATIGNRLISAWYFMGLGWYVTLTTALALLVVGAHSGGSRGTRWVMGTVVLCVVLLAVLFLWNPVAAQRAITRAAWAEAHGRREDAIADYRRAMRLDGWHARNVGVYQRIGAIDAGLGRTSTAEYRIYYAEDLVAQIQPFAAIPQSVTIGQLPEAIAVYDGLAAGGSSISELARTRAAELWTEYGLHLFAAGAFGSAVDAWEKALAREPGMWLASFYLTRGYFVVGRYRDAAELAKVVAATSDPVWFAILSCNIGDAHTRMGDLDFGHRAYFNAYDLDYFMDDRALYSLFGR